MTCPPPSGRQREPIASLAVKIVALASLSALAACQSMPTDRSGYLSSYEGLGDGRNGEHGPSKRRDDTASNALTRVYIEPSVLRVSAKTSVRPENQVMVRQEIDRQMCFRLSKRFDIVSTPEPDAGRVRTAIVHIAPTNPAGSAATAAASFFIPVPIVKFRGPGISGALAAEAELVGPEGQQVAAIAWAKSTEGLSKMDPSLSPVGDALQLAEPFAKAASDAFATKARRKRPIAKPDPCARFGPRRSAGRMVGGAIIGFGTGLYAPSVAGAGRPPEAEAAENPEP